MSIRVFDWQSDETSDANMPKANVGRAIQHGGGSLDGVDYEEVGYEAYGISGAAIIVDCMTENRISTVDEVSHENRIYRRLYNQDAETARRPGKYGQCTKNL